MWPSVPASLPDIIARVGGGISPAFLEALGVALSRQTGTRPGTTSASKVAAAEQGRADIPGLTPESPTATAGSTLGSLESATMGGRFGSFTGNPRSETALLTLLGLAPVPFLNVPASTGKAGDVVANLFGVGRTPPNLDFILNPTATALSPGYAYSGSPTGYTGLITNPQAGVGLSGPGGVTSGPGGVFTGGPQGMTNDQALAMAINLALSSLEMDPGMGGPAGSTGAAPGAGESGTGPGAGAGQA